MTHDLSFWHCFDLRGLVSYYRSTSVIWAQMRLTKCNEHSNGPLWSQISFSSKPGDGPSITLPLSLSFYIIYIYLVVGQNGSGQNGTDKMVWTKWYGQNGIGQNGTDKLVWTKWYNFIFCVHFNSGEFNIHLVTKSHE